MCTAQDVSTSYLTLITRNLSTDSNGFHLFIKAKESQAFPRMPALTIFGFQAASASILPPRLDTNALSKYYVWYSV